MFKKLYYKLLLKHLIILITCNDNREEDPEDSIPHGHITSLVSRMYYIILYKY